jgi:hypothetical protein
MYQKINVKWYMRVCAIWLKNIFDLEAKDTHDDKLS